MKINLDTPSEEVQIQIVPLIDVIFCILTFFLLAALQLTRQQSITVDLPKATTGATQMQDMLIVSVDSLGQTYIDQQPVSRSQLYENLLAYRQRNPNGLMVLYAPKLAIYDDVVQVLDLLRSVGGDRVALATLPNSASPTTPASPGATPNLNGLPGNTPGSFLNSPGITPAPTGSPFLFSPTPAPGSVTPFGPGQASPGEFNTLPASPVPSLTPGAATPPPQ